MGETQYSNDVYLTGLRKGDRATLDHIYQEFYPRIANSIRANSGTDDDARDIFQDGIMVMYKKAADPDFSLNAAFFTFLYAVCRNLWLKKLRKKDRDWVTIDEGMVSIAEPPVEDEEMRQEAQYQLYRRTLKTLGAQCQQLLKLSLAGKRIREIVKIMQFSSEGYARKRKFKCKEQLVKRIQQDPTYQMLRGEE